MAENDVKESAAEGGDDTEAVQKKSAVEGASAPASNQKLILIVLVLNAVVLVALAAVVWMSNSKNSKQVTLGDIAAEKDSSEKGHGAEGEGGGHGGEHGKEGKNGEEAVPENNFIKESFTVNLSGGRGSRFAKVDVEIEVKDDFVREEVNRLRPKIRDFILVVLSSKTYEQVESVDGRDFLREEIRNKINGYLTRGRIENVFFTQFIIQ